MERVIKTLKQKLWRYFEYTGKENWIDVLDKIVYNYNHSKHRSHGYAPAKIKRKDHDIILTNLYSKFAKLKPRKPKFLPGSLVRISEKKLTFTKKYMSHYSQEIFRIKCVHTKIPVVSYKIEDLSGNLINGIFVEPELSPAALNNGA